MAEFVELRLEEMLPELEQTERVGLLTPEEVRSIIKKRRDFEYKIQRRTKKKEDYLKYIQYELSIYKLLKLRRKKNGYSFKRDEIEHAISNRIGSLFRFCVFRFQDDIKLWLSYIDFCKQVKFTNKISKIFVRMLAVHNDKPYLWLMAAKWEFEENQSADNARAILLRGLQFLPDSKELYLESFRLELLYVDRLLKRKQILGIESKELNRETEDEVLKGKLAEVVYTTAIEKIPESLFVVQFLGIVKAFDFGNWLEQKIMSDLIENYSTDEYTWDTLARRDLEGRNQQNEINTGEIPDENAMEVDNSKVQKPPKFSIRFQRCCDTYEKGLEIIDSEKLAQFYLATLLELRNSSKHIALIVPKLLEVLELCNEKGYLSESLFITWIELVKDLKKWDDLESIAEQATKKFPQNAKFWLEWLEAHFDQHTTAFSTDLFVIDTGSAPVVEESMAVEKHIDSDSEESDCDSESETEKIPKVFYDAVQALGDTKEALPVWEFVSKWLINKGKKVADSVEKLFEQSTQRKPVISQVLNITYLEWTAKVKGLTKARDLYKRLSFIPPFSLEFHRKMVELEMEKVGSDTAKNVRAVYESACDQFGKDNPDIWLEYVRFEKSVGDQMKVPSIYRKAKAVLVAGAAVKFQNEFVLISTGISK